MDVIKFTIQIYILKLISNFNFWKTNINDIYK